MARGWESKSVEDQISDAEERRRASGRSMLSEAEIDRERRVQGLLMERARITREMEQSHKRRYLVLLERGLAHIDAELAKLQQEDGR